VEEDSLLHPRGPASFALSRTSRSISGTVFRRESESAKFDDWMRKASACSRAKTVVVRPRLTSEANRAPSHAIESSIAGDGVYGRSGNANSACGTSAPSLRADG